MDIRNDARPLLQAIGFERLVHSAPEGVARVRFAPRSEFAHTEGTIVQGGFVTAWLDNAMAFAVAARDAQVRLASLELKVSFLERVGVAPVEAEARVLRWGGSVVFLEAQLMDADGGVLARASSTGKLLRPR
ncbi:PaaI family thioesterase [Xenophilus azovorans]|uniref:PaaI family thioesterase n=1 Tax=Xenophilus azovorans TaxID=151755 RepID=UPI00056F68B2|nr:PaaI family thioesterase [Xenophilus azovorans]